MDGKKNSMKKNVMRKTAVALLALGCAACRGEDIQDMKKTDVSEPVKILVACFSHTGNTREVVRQIQAATGGDLFEIVPAAPYPTAYQAVVDQAKREIQSGTRPALRTNLASVAEYDVVFVGSPNWWSTIAPPVATFLASHDWSGKTIVPFMTHEGTRMGHSVKDIQKLCPGAIVRDGLPIRGGQVHEAQKQVEDWVNEIQKEMTR